MCQLQDLSLSGNWNFPKGKKLFFFSLSQAVKIFYVRIWVVSEDLKNRFMKTEKSLWKLENFKRQINANEQAAKLLTTNAFLSVKDSHLQLLKRYTQLNHLVSYSCSIRHLLFGIRNSSFRPTWHTEPSGHSTKERTSNPRVLAPSRKVSLFLTSNWTHLSCLWKCDTKCALFPNHRICKMLTKLIKTNYKSFSFQIKSSQWYIVPMSHSVMVAAYQHRRIISARTHHLT